MPRIQRVAERNELGQVEKEIVEPLHHARAIRRARGHDDRDCQRVNEQRCGGGSPSRLSRQIWEEDDQIEDGPKELGHDDGQLQLGLSQWDDPHLLVEVANDGRIGERVAFGGRPRGVAKSPVRGT
mgnify:CR=1 FL=1